MDLRLVDHVELAHVDGGAQVREQLQALERVDVELLRVDADSVALQLRVIQRDVHVLEEGVGVRAVFRSPRRLPRLRAPATRGPRCAAGIRKTRAARAPPPLSPPRRRGRRPQIRRHQGGEQRRSLGAAATSSSATLRSTLSPNGCPSVSLMSLKWSRSMSTRPGPSCCARCASARALSQLKLELRAVAEARELIVCRVVRVTSGRRCESVGGHDRCREQYQRPHAVRRDQRRDAADAEQTRGS